MSLLQSVWLLLLLPRLCRVRCSVAAANRRAAAQPTDRQTEMSAPQAIPGAAAAAKPRSRSQTFAYNRLDADGNVHHLPPDAAPGARSFSPTTAAGVGSGGILSMLGLSPKSSTSNSTIIPFAAASSSSFAESPSTSSSYSYSASSSSTTEDAPEAVTPPLYQSTSSSRNTLPAIEQLDEDVFDDDLTLSSGPGGTNPGATRAPFHLRSASVGRPVGELKSRRASWSPAARAGELPQQQQQQPPLSASPNTVTNWLQAQEKSATNSTSPTWAWYSQQRDSGFKDTSSNPIGLFRRLSVSSAPRKVR